MRHGENHVRLQALLTLMFMISAGELAQTSAGDTHWSRYCQLEKIEYAPVMFMILPR